MSSAGAFAAPALFEVLLDRIATSVYPSERYVMSAALSARSPEQIDDLLHVLGRQLIGQYPSPRRLELIGLVAARRQLLGPALDAAEKIRDGDDDIPADDLRAAVKMLEQTRQLLND